MALQQKLPISFSSQRGFDHLNDVLSSIKQDFTNLLLTNPNEKINSPDFGVGLMKYLFEFDSPVYRDDISIAIQEQVKKFMPFVTITNISFLTKDDLLYIKIEYFVTNQNNNDQIDLKVNTEEA
jgi:phage baseplate assembly protein W